jgi:hypothetical protein
MSDLLFLTGGWIVGLVGGVAFGYCLGAGVYVSYVREAFGLPSTIPIAHWLQMKALERRIDREANHE